MVLDRYEYSEIKNNELPVLWQTQGALEELRAFLQENWSLRTAFYSDEDRNRKQQFLEFTGSKGIKTKKYIGTIVYKGEQLNIFPRVFKTGPADYNTDSLSTKYFMSNLVKWIEYCNKLEYPYLTISSKLNETDDLRELFVKLYISYVQIALDRGVFFHYVDETEDCRSIKGRIDLKDYLTSKLPSGNAVKFLCTYSKFEFDNKVNRIIKHTCKYLYKMASAKDQRALRIIITRLDEVTDEHCSPHDCDTIRLGNANKNYRIILSLSKMFLLNKTTGYSLDANDSFCFLFPTELLFEGFIGGFMKEALSDYGGKVKLQAGDKYLVDNIIFNGETGGPAFVMRHDILVEIQDKIVILDTKYKEVSRFENNPNYVDRIKEEIDQADLYQMIAYAWKRGIQDIYLLYPLYRLEDAEMEFPYAVCKGPAGGNDIRIHFIRIPFVFDSDKEDTRSQLIKVIKQIFELQ